MDKQLETTDRQSKRRGFFDRPGGVDFWMNAGGRFLGGLVIGFGLGVFFGARLKEDEFFGAHNRLWSIGTMMALYAIGLAITHRAIRRSTAPGTVRSET